MKKGWSGLCEPGSVLRSHIWSEAKCGANLLKSVAEVARGRLRPYFAPFEYVCLHGYHLAPKASFLLLSSQKFQTEREEIFARDNNPAYGSPTNGFATQRANSPEPKGECVATGIMERNMNRDDLKNEARFHLWDLIFYFSRYQPPFPSGFLFDRLRMHMRRVESGTDGVRNFRLVREKRSTVYHLHEALASCVRG